MKKIIFLFFTILFLSACNNTQSELSNVNTKYVHSESKIIDEYNYLEEMENDSEVILIGTKKNGESYFDKDGDMVTGFYTISDVEIKKVFKNEKGYTLNKGNIIKVMENGAFDKKANTMYGSAGYQLMKDNKSYLLFLRKSTTHDEYTIKGVYYGKVPLDSNHMEYKGDLNSSKQVNNKQIEKLNQLFEEARKKYRE
ncbi:membrane lipoprotein lipid attachment site-containing protein [Anoxybacillus sp. ST4]|uniref:membrane lipoprotein lipid attachment site-containing protein n=1 Tax=unclassified Anoxybacillus TaxID=2639704 RepID=UPI001C63C823|nr:membrane lipoprotein lipid attachment site-containing protein [Anoxybacillus sp. ST4]MBW7651157.1 membrane lipoprotein lipid attachment site-containing protein [Anoxybacillus sp. ST4]